MRPCVVLHQFVTHIAGAGSIAVRLNSSQMPCLGMSGTPGGIATRVALLLQRIPYLFSTDQIPQAMKPAPDRPSGIRMAGFLFLTQEDAL